MNCVTSARNCLRRVWLDDGKCLDSDILLIALYTFRILVHLTNVEHPAQGSEFNGIEFFFVRLLKRRL